MLLISYTIRPKYCSLGTLYIYTFVRRQVTAAGWSNLAQVDGINQIPALLMNGFSLLKVGESLKVTSVPNIPGYELLDLYSLLEHTNDPQLYRPSKIVQQIQVG